MVLSWVTQYTTGARAEILAVFAGARPSVALTVALANYVDAVRAGRVYHGPFNVILSNHDVFEPDLLVVLNDQLGIVGPKSVRGERRQSRPCAGAGA